MRRTIEPNQINELLADSTSGQYTRKQLAKKYKYKSASSFFNSAKYYANKEGVELSFKSGRGTKFGRRKLKAIQTSSVVTEYKNLNDFKTRKKSQEFRTIKFGDGLSIQVEKNAGTNLYVQSDGTVIIN